MNLRFCTVATILGNPVYWGSPYRDYMPKQLAALSALGVETAFVNLAWSRPWMDAVTLEEVHVSPSYPWRSDPVAAAANRGRLRARSGAVAAAGLRPFFLFGCPAQIDLNRLSPDARASAEGLIGQRVSRIDPNLSVACIQSPNVRLLYKELLQAHFEAIPETVGILFYTMDELAEVCDETGDCPRCHDAPLHERLPDFLGYLREVINELKPGVEMWWEPWEFTAEQTYAVVERLTPGIKVAVHTSIHEVYYTNRPDPWLRTLCRLAGERGIAVIVEGFFSGAGEDLGPLPAYPCPRLVYEQLKAISELPAVSGIKEYFGTVAEHVSTNDRVLREFLRQPNASFESIIADLAGQFDGATAAPLLDAWEEATRAVEAFPWDLSWRMRQYNSIRYDQPMGAGVWAHDFTATLPTPWTTPSWESSRNAAYVVSLSTAVITPRLLMETEERLKRCIHHLDRALERMQTVAMAASAELQLQADSIRLFRHLALSRRFHLQASRLASGLRSNPAPERFDKLEVCLRDDHRNARELLDLIRAGGYQGFERSTMERMIAGMELELTEYARDPRLWLQTHLVETR